jgi:hypothetical protein
MKKGDWMEWNKGPIVKANSSERFVEPVSEVKWKWLGYHIIGLPNIS